MDNSPWCCGGGKRWFSTSRTQFKIPTGKCSFYLHPPDREVWVQWCKVIFRSAQLELIRIQSLARGHLRRVDNCHIGGLNLVPPVEGTCLSLNYHGVLNFKLREWIVIACCSSTSSYRRLIGIRLALTLFILNEDFMMLTLGVAIIFVIES